MQQSFITWINICESKISSPWRTDRDLYDYIKVSTHVEQLMRVYQSKLEQNKTEHNKSLQALGELNKTHVSPQTLIKHVEQLWDQYGSRLAR